MPPHDDTIDAIAATALHGTTTAYNTGGVVHDTMVDPRTITGTITDPLYRPYKHLGHYQGL